MEPAKMKPLLSLSKREPVQAAIALTADGVGVILLDKKAKPRKVGEMLKADATKNGLKLNLASLRYGRAEVDPDYDPAMVRFFINKDAPGTLRPKLVEVVRLVAYQKVEINVDPSLEEESEEEGEQQEAADGGPGTAPEETTTTTTAPTVDQAETALRHALAGLIARIPAAAGDDAARKATMLKVAGMANDQLKTHNAQAANVTLKARRI